MNAWTAASICDATTFRSNRWSKASIGLRLLDITTPGTLAASVFTTMQTYPTRDVVTAPPEGRREFELSG